MSNIRTLLVSFNFTHDAENTFMLVGEKQKGVPINILNFLQGEEVLDIYKKLTVKDGKKNGGNL